MVEREAGFQKQKREGREEKEQNPIQKQPLPLGENECTKETKMSLLWVYMQKDGERPKRESVSGIYDVYHQVP